MEATTNKTTGTTPEPAKTKKGGASKVGKIIGIILSCLVVLSIVILIIGDEWITLGVSAGFFIAGFFIASIKISSAPMSEYERQKLMEAKTNKTATEKATTKVENKGSGTWFVWMMLSCFVMMALAGEWYLIAFLIALFIFGLEIPMKTNITEEERKEQQERERKVADFITLM